MLDLDMNEAAALEHHAAMAKGDTAKAKGVAVAMYAASCTTQEALQDAYVAQGQSKATGDSWYDSGKAYRALVEKDPEFWAKEEHAFLVRRRFTTSAKGKGFMSSKGTPLTGKGLISAITKAANLLDASEPDNTDIVAALRAGYGKEPGQESRWLQTARTKCAKVIETGDEATRDELLVALDIIGAALGDNGTYAEVTA